MSKTNIAEEPSRGAGRAPLIIGMISAIALGLTALYVWPSAPKALTNVSVVVYKTPTCGCCGDWVAHLEEAGLEVRVVNVESTQAMRAQAGVPNALGSCHTAVVGDYFVEGHVPADLIQALMTSKPDNLRGIAVPGMPVGSPGMEGPNPVEYDVLAYDEDGRTFVYATRQGASSK